MIREHPPLRVPELKNEAIDLIKRRSSQWHSLFNGSLGKSKLAGHGLRRDRTISINSSGEQLRLPAIRIELPMTTLSANALRDHANEPVPELDDIAH